MTTSKKKQRTNTVLSNSKLALFSLAGFAAADQPVHCLKNDVLGDWTFEVIADSYLPDLFGSLSVCTHELPNKLQIIEPGHVFNLGPDTYKVSVTLNDDNTCEANQNGRRIKRNECHWTMMYDQLLSIHLPEDDLFANLRYEVKEGQEAQWDRLQTGDYDKFWSKCDETMVGLLRSR